MGNKALKLRLIVMNFLQFFIWGSWLISFGGYLGGSLHFSGFEIGSIYAAMGIASLFMPGIIGIIADRWINAERLLGICHLIGGAALFAVSGATSYSTIYPLMLLHTLFFMPTIALTNTVAYSLMEKENMDIEKEFPPIRVWGTIGFILAMWLVDILGWARSNIQLYQAGFASLALAVYAFTLPACPPEGKNVAKKSLASALGLDAFVLFKQKKMAIFFCFALLLGAALQITNTFGNPFLDSFKESYADSFAVQHPNVLLSLSQISETLFILSIPFFLKRFGIKIVMLMSMAAWTLRFAFFGIGNPGGGFIFLILSMIVYGMAFDFFNISGSIFVERETSPSMRGSAQGLFMIMTNGIGAILGSYGSGFIVDYFTKYADNGEIITRNWNSIWFTFAIYTLIIGIMFAIVFKYKHNQSEKEIA